LQKSGKGERGKGKGLVFFLSPLTFSYKSAKSNESKRFIVVPLPIIDVPQTLFELVSRNTKLN
jgi:hypothetical protein